MNRKKDKISRFLYELSKSYKPVFVLSAVVLLIGVVFDSEIMLSAGFLGVALSFLFYIHYTATKKKTYIIMLLFSSFLLQSVLMTLLWWTYEGNQAFVTVSEFIVWIPLSLVFLFLAFKLFQMTEVVFLNLIFEGSIRSRAIKILVFVSLFGVMTVYSVSEMGFDFSELGLSESSLYVLSVNLAFWFFVVFFVVLIVGGFVSYFERIARDKIGYN